MTTGMQALMAQAAKAESEGDFRTSERIYREVLTQSPNNREAFLYHSLTLARLGKTEESIRQLRHFVTLDPKSVIALNWLSRLLRDSGKLRSALRFSEQAVVANPRDIEAIYNLGLCYLGLSRFEEAIACFEKSTTLVDGFGPGYYALACAYESIGQPWPALVAIEKNVRIDSNPTGFLKLAQICLAVGQSERAVEYGLKAFEAIPSPAANLVLAEAFADSDPEQSQSHLDSAKSLDPSLEPRFENSRAKHLSRLGRLDEARALNAKIRDDARTSSTAFLNWVTINKIDQEDTQVVERMTELLDTKGLSWEDKCALHFALGKSFDDLGDFAKAINHYDQANALKRANTPALSGFDPQVFSARIDFTIDLFSKRFLAENSNLGNPSNRPIFVVGMIRTGTTLIEQILSRHPDVAAGGELAHWPFSTKKIVDVERKQLRAGSLKASAEGYLELLKVVDPDAKRIIDKNPANLLEVGLIRAAFPEAHFIQMERNPIDTAMSIFITPTRQSPDFCCDRENIAFAIRETRRLADHWREVIPEEQYHVVRYEDLVRDPDAVAQAVLKDCGLDPAKFRLDSDGAQSIIGTPSLWQARQPVTTSSIGRSKRYEPWLGAFKTLD